MHLMVLSAKYHEKSWIIIKSSVAHLFLLGSLVNVTNPTGEKDDKTS
jgi:hypothetical protein